MMWDFKPQYAFSMAGVIDIEGVGEADLKGDAFIIGNSLLFGDGRWQFSARALLRLVRAVRGRELAVRRAVQRPQAGPRAGGQRSYLLPPRRGARDARGGAALLLRLLSPVLFGPSEAAAVGRMVG